MLVTTTKMGKCAFWKVCLHHSLTMKRRLIHVCRLVRCLNSPHRLKKKGLRKSIREKVAATKPTKTQGLHSKQNTASCKQRRIENDSSEAWYCLMCDDTVKEDMIKCQVCLRWAHSACTGVVNGLDVCHTF